MRNVESEGTWKFYRWKMAKFNLFGYVKKKTCKASGLGISKKTKNIPHHTGLPHPNFTMAPPPPSDQITRASNKTSHPGLPDVDQSTLARSIPKRRRTQAEVQADKIAEVKLKKENEEKERKKADEKIASLKAIAELENRMGADDAETTKNAA